MKSRKWFIGLLAAIVVIAVGVSIALVVDLSPSSPSEEGDQAQQQISIEQAMESVRQFENASLPDLELTRMPDYPLHSHIELSSGNTTYGVNPETGAVEMAVYLDNVGGGEAVLPIKEAETVAAAFAERHYPAFASLTLDESELLDHGASIEYLVIWVELVDGVPTPNKVLVSVNPATGEVIYYVGKHQLIEPFDSPSVSLEKAKEIAEDAYRREKTGVKELTVGESLLGEPVQQVILVDGKQHLAWTVEVRESFTDDGIEIGALFFIDAHTGAVLQVFGF